MKLRVPNLYSYLSYRVFFPTPFDVFVMIGNACTYSALRSIMNVIAIMLKVGSCLNDHNFVHFFFLFCVVFK